MPDQVMLKPIDVAEHLNVTTRTLTNWRNGGSGPPYVDLAGGQSKPVIRYNKVALEIWIDEKSSQ